MKPAKWLRCQGSCQACNLKSVARVATPAGGLRSSPIALRDYVVGEGDCERKELVGPHRKRG